MRQILFSLSCSLLLAVPAWGQGGNCDLLAPKFYQSATATTVVHCFSVHKWMDARDGDGNGNTPLHVAVVHSTDTALVRLMLAKGADASIWNAGQWAPTDSLAELGHVASHVAALKAAGTDVNAASSQDACRSPLRTCATIPLHRVAGRSGVADLLRAFLAAGADVASIDGKGRTALHHAARQAGWEEVEALVAAGAKINVSDFDGYTPLHLAAQRGPAANLPAADYALVRLLLDLGADADAKNDDGQIPLLLAAAYSDDNKIWHELYAATKPDLLCDADKKGRTVKAMFNQNAKLKRDKDYWGLNQLCP